MIYAVAISERWSLTLRHLTNRIDKSIKCRNIQEPHGWHGIKRFQSQQHDCLLPFFFSNSTSMRIQRELASSIRCVCGAQALSSLLCFPPTKYFGYYDDCLSHHLSPFFLSVSHTHLVLQYCEITQRANPVVIEMTRCDKLSDVRPSISRLMSLFQSPTNVVNFVQLGHKIFSFEERSPSSRKY